VVLREIALREELVSTLRRMAAGGLVRGTEGNASARTGSGLVAISPTGLAYDTLRPEDVALVEPNGTLLEGARPSVELPLHLAVLAARPEIGAVVHTHSPHATALSVDQDEVAGVPVAEAAPSGSAELGAAVLAAAGEGDAVVVRGHGPVCFGPDLAAALGRAVALEEQARNNPSGSGVPSLRPR
jgi:ribulose-5-phosphate 4-epimerase/fuculose-1-phosphate aldolase